MCVCCRREGDRQRGAQGEQGIEEEREGVCVRERQCVRGSPVGVERPHARCPTGKNDGKEGRTFFPPFSSGTPIALPEGRTTPPGGS